MNDTTIFVSLFEEMAHAGISALATDVRVSFQFHFSTLADNSLLTTGIVAIQVRAEVKSPLRLPILPRYGTCWAKLLFSGFA